MLILKEGSGGERERETVKEDMRRQEEKWEKEKKEMIEKIEKMEKNWMKEGRG